MIKHITGIPLQQGGHRDVAMPGDALSAGAGPNFILQIVDLAPAARNVAEGTVEVRNRLGLHIRPSTMVAKAAIRYLSTITIARGNKHASARSATSLEMLKARLGTHLKIRAEGPDAKDALKAVQALFEKKFGED